MISVAIRSSFLHVLRDDLVGPDASEPRDAAHANETPPASVEDPLPDSEGVSLHVVLRPVPESELALVPRGTRYATARVTRCKLPQPVSPCPCWPVITSVAASTPRFTLRVGVCSCGICWRFSALRASSKAVATGLWNASAW